MSLEGWRSCRKLRIRSSHMMRCPISASRPAAANPALEAHQRKLGRMPRRVAADAGYYSQTHEEAARKMGVDYVSIPNRSTRSEERRKLQRRRWFNNGQTWRTGCEGRIRTVKHRHGLAGCRYRGLDGMWRWVGLGIVADTLINIGRHLIPKTS